MKDQLVGILDPKSRLSKFICYGLQYNDNHREYARNLVFDYRSSIEFYKTPAYELNREHAKIRGHILRKGVEDDVFRNDVDIRLIREIIYGTLDAEAIGCVLVRDVEKSTDDWHDILFILLRMIETGVARKHVTKRQKIIETAEKVFAEFGFNKARISEIAKRAGVAEGSIYDYFENKEDLLLSVSKFRIERLNKDLRESFQIKTP